MHMLCWYNIKRKMYMILIVIMYSGIHIISIQIRKYVSKEFMKCALLLLNSIFQVLPLVEAAPFLQVIKTHFVAYEKASGLAPDCPRFPGRGGHNARSKKRCAEERGKPCRKCARPSLPPGRQSSVLGAEPRAHQRLPPNSRPAIGTSQGMGGGRGAAFHGLGQAGAVIQARPRGMGWGAQRHLRVLH